MVQPIDIAIHIHKVCEDNPTSPGVAAPHDVSYHAATTSLYAESINEAGLSHVTGEQAAKAIVKASGWDIIGPWPGHPSRESVIDELRVL